MLKEEGKKSHCQKIPAFEKRKYPHLRFPTTLPIEYWRINHPKSDFGQTINIGEGGLRVSLPEQIGVDEKLRVKLSFSFGSCLNTIETFLKVAWAKIDAEKGGFYQHGLIFEDTSRSDIKKAIGFLKLFSDK
jgi:hypothetical protein